MRCPFLQELDFQKDWKLISVFFSNTSQSHLCPSAQQVNLWLGGVADVEVGSRVNELNLVIYSVRLGLMATLSESGQIDR